MPENRQSGVLLHPTSLPNPEGIGTLGAEARAFVDWLAEAGQRLWQVLPLGPTGYGNSPYACESAFAGNPLLIDLTILVQRGFLSEASAQAPKAKTAALADFDTVKAWKVAALREAHARFIRTAPPMERGAFEAFCRAPENDFWLEDFAHFSAMKAAFGGTAWTEWPEALRDRNPAALYRWSGENEEAVDFHRFCQWLFSLQWDALRAYAHERDVEIVGDMPIFVAHDSADVWANPTLFFLDDEGRSVVVAGVPPDYFSKTGQRWGNPLYRWDVMSRDGFRWWVERFRTALRQVDLIRIDHFRGFAAYWEIPGDEETAINGTWVPGPGAHFFATLNHRLGDLPLIAEDLGTITPDVHELRDRFGLPGMKILQFAFSGPDNAYLPHNYDNPNCVVYTGTHDNDTSKGWWKGLSKEERAGVRDIIGTKERDIAWALIRAASFSTARVALFPLQDILSLPTAARMNEPSKPSGNWGWRFKDGDLTEALAVRLRALTTQSNRNPT